VAIGLDAATSLVDGRERCRQRGETASGLAEGAITELASATGLARQRGKQVVQLGLNAGAHPGEHHRQQAGKSERALAGKGGWGQTRSRQKFWVEQRVTEPGQQRFGVEDSSS